MKSKADLKLSSKPKRNYQFVQFLLDFFGVCQLFLVAVSIIDSIDKSLEFNRQAVKLHGEQVGQLNPYPLIVWGIVAVLVYAAGIIIPFIFKNKTRYNQKQYDMWVYAMLLIRVLAIVMVTYLVGIHHDFLIRRFGDILSFQTLFRVMGSAILVAVLVRFTKIRIDAAEPKTQEKKRTIMED
jgi:uncharacterized membrane protein